MSDYVAIRPTEILLYAFEITSISKCDQFAFIQQSEAYPTISLLSFEEAWDELDREGLIEVQSRMRRCRSHDGENLLCPEWHHTQQGRLALQEIQLARLANEV